MALGTWTAQQNLPDAHNDMPPFSGYVQALVLASGTAEAVAVPSGATHVIFRATDHFMAKAGASGVAAAWATGDVTDGSGSELNPDFRHLAGEAYISCVAASSCIVTLAFHRVKQP